MTSVRQVNHVRSRYLRAVLRQVRPALMGCGKGLLLETGKALEQAMPAASGSAPQAGASRMPAPCPQPPARPAPGRGLL